MRAGVGLLLLGLDMRSDDVFDGDIAFGSFLQAHLYLGARADPGRRRELAALFDSLRFRR
ncbi:MAG: hypothetical protein WKF94_02365 [Solirubrobacteraceae bacterium]